LVLPPGWLALGTASLAEGSPIPALLGTIGLGLIGTLSLRRSYRTTLRIYTGQIGSRRRKMPAPEPAPRDDRPRVLLLERRLPWLAEPAAAVALGTLRSLIRAPEAKMMFLTAPFMMAVFGSMLFTRSTPVSAAMSPMLATGAMAMVLFSQIQFIGNAFGFDRAGFRIFVLSGVRRRDILLGKNLAVAPLALVLIGIVIVVLQCVYPMSLQHLAAAFPQFVAMYLMFCLVGNLVAIFAPMPIAAGSMRAVKPNFMLVLLHLGFTFLFPVALAPMLLPLGAEAVLQSFGYPESYPICLLLMLPLCALVIVFYLVALSWEGDLLQWRELKILEAVTPKAE
jgi:hypothetical protein